MNNINVSQELYDSLKKYEARYSNSKSYSMYLFYKFSRNWRTSTTIEEMDKELEELAAAQDKLDSLNKHFSQFENKFFVKLFVIKH